MPIGSAARYVPAGIPVEANGVGFDNVFVVKTSASDPARSWNLPGSWTSRCSGSAATGTSIRIPNSFMVADATQRADGGWDTPNYAGVFLRPDGRTTDNTSGVARCSATGPIFGYKTGDPKIDSTDIYGDGTLGSHGASHLSSLGGLIRPGELSSSAPIQHALDLVLYAKYMNYGASKGFRWPAVSADAYASSSTYAGGNAAYKMGSLLALSPGLTPEAAGITSPVAQKIFYALQNYGAYATDDAAWDFDYISIDKSAVGTFTWTKTEQTQVNKIISMLNVVDNNSASSIGGGGTPRQPLLPELLAPGSQPTTAPTTAPTTTPTTTAPTAAPTTAAPTTAAPTTSAPMAAPTTAAPTSAPSTAAPVTSVPVKPPINQDTIGTSSVRYVSDLAYQVSNNGWGPVEKDRSGAEAKAGDGRTLTIAGKQYAKGLGAASYSEIHVALGGKCSTFTATVGLDDETNGRGQVVFQVSGDSTVLYNSGYLRARTAKSISVNVANRKDLVLRVGDAGDGTSYDHADWANMKLTCTA